MNKKNIIHATISGVASVIPGVNGIAEFYNTYLQGQSEDRRDNVEREFREKFYSINKKLNSLNDLIKNNPSNFAIFLNSIKGAYEDISAGKIKYYVNSSLNAIQDEDIDNVKIHIFLNFLRKYSLLHIMVLEYFNKPHFQQSIAPEGLPINQFIIDIIQKDNPNLSKDIVLLNIIMKELYDDDMIYISSLDGLRSITSNGFDKCTKPFGEEFLKFISDNS